MNEDVVRNFIASAGIGPDSVDEELFINSFMAEMQKGVEKKESSLPMIPTYVSCDWKLPLEKYAVAIDAGGTNFRTALLKFTEDGASLEQFHSYPMPGTRGKVTWQEFIGFAAGCIRPLMRFTDRIGICISFPTEVTPDCDGIICRFTKEVNIEGFEGRRVCEDLLDALDMDGAQAMVLNDTTAVLLSGLVNRADPEGLIGLINGTGTNACCILPCSHLGMGEGNMIVDIESGSFMPPWRSETDLYLDAHTNSPGVYPEEKLVSGAYLGEICRLALLQAAKEGLFSAVCAEKLSALEEFSTAEADGFGAGEESGIFSAPDDILTARMIIQAVFKRAAKHIACILSAVIRYTEIEEGHSVVVSADGSVFRKSRLFRPALEEYVSVLAAGWPVTYMEMENSTIIGTAVGALIHE